MGFRCADLGQQVVREWLRDLVGAEKTPILAKGEPPLLAAYPPATLNRVQLDVIQDPDQLVATLNDLAIRLRRTELTRSVPQAVARQARIPLRGGGDPLSRCANLGEFAQAGHPFQSGPKQPVEMTRHKDICPRVVPFSSEMRQCRLNFPGQPLVGQATGLRSEVQPLIPLSEDEFPPVPLPVQPRHTARLNFPSEHPFRVPNREQPLGRDAVRLASGDEAGRSGRLPMRKFPTTELLAQGDPAY